MVLGTKGIGEKLDGHLDGHIHKWDGGHVINVEQKKGNTHGKVPLGGHFEQAKAMSLICGKRGLSPKAKVNKTKRKGPSLKRFHDGSFSFSFSKRKLSFSLPFG